jgi:hypothetical protein
MLAQCGSPNTPCCGENMNCSAAQCYNSRCRLQLSSGLVVLKNTVLVRCQLVFIRRFVVGKRLVLFTNRCGLAC